MNKRIRKKIAKRAAEHEHEHPLPPTAALRHAVEELRDGVMHLLETALYELQQTTSALVSELRSRAGGVFAQAKHSANR